MAVPLAMSSNDVEHFYDELTEYYELLFEDWNASMARQGAILAKLLSSTSPDANAPVRVLDAAAGIGTQSLALASRQFVVTSRDLSSAAIARLEREAASRDLKVEASVVDMRYVDQSISEKFDALIALDNSIAHLLAESDLETAFRAFRRCLRPGGVCLISVRDYGAVARGKPSVQSYGVRMRNGVRHIPIQVWDWVDENHYDGTFYVVIDAKPKAETRSVTTRFRAIPVSRLLQLLAEAGFEGCECLKSDWYQPMLLARAPW